MPSVRSRRAPILPSEVFALDHPFVRWFAAYHKRDAALAEGADIFMGPLASRRFAIGVDDDAMPVLGIPEEDVEAILSVNWTSAAFLRRVQGPKLADAYPSPDQEPGDRRRRESRDWVALSAKDARIEGCSSQDAVPMRLWLPTQNRLLDGWIGADEAPVALRLVEITIRRGKPTRSSSEDLGLLSLGFKGVWEAPKSAAA